MNLEQRIRVRDAELRILSEIFQRRLLAAFLPIIKRWIP